MIRRFRFLALKCIVTCIVAAAAASGLGAQEATVSPVSGTVEVLPAPGGAWEVVESAAAFGPDARVRTGANGFALIRYADSTEVVVRPGSEVELGGTEDEGLLVLLGKVLLRVRRLLTPGQERTHRTPTTVAAVRGTEFGLAVEPSGRTRVFVFEGLVAVTNPEVPEEAVEVGAGTMTRVDPGQPPTMPRAFQPSEFAGGAGGEVERGEDRAVEGGQAPVALRYLAFPDADLDALSNPAFLGTRSRSGVSALGLLDAAAGSASVTEDGKELGPRDDVHHRALAQGMAVGSWGSLRVGAFTQGDRGRDRALRNIRAPGEVQVDPTWDDTDWSTGEARILGALARGNRSFGVMVGHRRGSVDSETETQGRAGEVVLTEAESRITTVSAGVMSSGRWSWALSAHHSLVEEERRGGPDRFDTDGSRTAVELLARRWRGSRGLGAWLRVERSRTEERKSDADGSVYVENNRVLTARLGTGLGFVPMDGVLVSVDLAGGLADESAVQSTRSGDLIEDEEDLRLSASLHLGSQVRLTGPWHADLSVLHALERIGRDYSYGPGDSGQSSLEDARITWNTRAVAGILYQGGTWTARYAVAAPTDAGRPWVHSLLVALNPGG